MNYYNPNEIQEPLWSPSAKYATRTELAMILKSLYNTPIAPPPVPTDPSDLETIEKWRNEMWKWKTDFEPLVGHLFIDFDKALGALLLLTVASSPPSSPPQISPPKIIPPKISPPKIVPPPFKDHNEDNLPPPIKSHRQQERNHIDRQLKRGDKWYLKIYPLKAGKDRMTIAGKYFCKELKSCARHANITYDRMRKVSSGSRHEPGIKIKRITDKHIEKYSSFL